MFMPMDEAIIVAFRIEAAQTLQLRSEVLRPGLPIEQSRFPGDYALTTFHAGALLGERIISIASIYLESRPANAPGGGSGSARASDHDAGTAWRLRGMATAPEFRSSGVGRIALQACIDHARANGGTLAWCNARTPAIGFYERMGWIALGDEFEIPTVGPHFVMELTLNE